MFSFGVGLVYNRIVRRDFVSLRIVVAGGGRRFLGKSGGGSGVCALEVAQDGLSENITATPTSSGQG